MTIELKNKWLKLTKLSQDNNCFTQVTVGESTVQGYFLKDEIEIGKQIFLYINKNENSTPFSWTSKVINADIIDDSTIKIKTENSTYIAEIQNEFKDLTFCNIMIKTYNMKKL